VRVLEAHLGELVEHPPSGALALLGWELPRVGHRPDGHQLGELLADLRHEVGDAGGSSMLTTRHVVGLEASTNSGTPRARQA
jgi:hypothetical protein